MVAARPEDLIVLHCFHFTSGEESDRCCSGVEQIDAAGPVDDESSVDGPRFERVEVWKRRDWASVTVEGLRRVGCIDPREPVGAHAYQPSLDL